MKLSNHASSSSSYRSSLLAFCSVLALAACGGSSQAPVSEPQPVASTAESEGSGDGAGDGAATYEQSVELCLQLVERQRECPDEFATMLVDVRAELDKPEGFAERVSTPEARAETIEAAKAEWMQDSTPERARQSCAFMVTSVPPEQMPQVQGMVQQCVATDSCDALIDCVRPIHTSMIAGR